MSRVVIVGLGSVASKHIAALSEIGGYEIYALRSGLSSAELSGVKSLHSLKELEAVHPDFAIISNPTFLHTKTIEALLKYGMPLFIEKPLSDNLDCYGLLEKISKNHIFTYVACNLRFLPCISFLKEKIKDRRINEADIYCGSYLPEWRKTDYRKSYSSNRAAGGGADLDLIHAVY